LKKNPGERSFALVAGHRRVAAGQAAGLAGTEGVIAKPSEDHDLLTLVENMGRRELTTYEKARALKSLQERRGLSENKTAQLAGISQASINRFFNALKSPEILRELWQEEQLSATAILTLKEHWQGFEKLENSTLIGQLKGLSRSDADSLRDQLGAGTPLETALIAIQKYDQTISPKKSKPTAQAQTKQADSKTKRTPVQTPENASFNKEALVTAIQDVFPRIKADKSESLYTSTLFYGNKDPKTLWAAALFVSRGGKVDRAVDISKKVMSDRSIASLINRQVKLVKLSSSLYKKYWKKNKDIKQYLKTVFR
jgi:ParB/RepB/Spo0J family partition protein